MWITNVTRAYNSKGVGSKWVKKYFELSIPLKLNLQEHNGGLEFTTGILVIFFFCGSLRESGQFCMY